MIDEKQSEKLPLDRAMDWLGSHLYISPKTKDYVNTYMNSATSAMTFSYGFKAGYIIPIAE